MVFTRSMISPLKKAKKRASPPPLKKKVSPNTPWQAFKSTAKNLLRRITQDANGTSLKGYVTTTFNKLKIAFGEPLVHIAPSAMEKVTIEWVIRFSDGTIATIYDWKGYGYQPAPNEVYEWHVGGHVASAVALVKDHLGLL